MLFVSSAANASWEERSTLFGSQLERDNFLKMPLTSFEQGSTVSSEGVGQANFDYKNSMLSQPDSQ